MLTFANENSTTIGNRVNSGKHKTDDEHQEDITSKSTLQLESLDRENCPDDLIFFASTDKARV